jgi:hypothetical protein
MMYQYCLHYSVGPPGNGCSLLKIVCPKRRPWSCNHLIPQGSYPLAPSRERVGVRGIPNRSISAIFVLRRVRPIMDVRPKKTGRVYLRPYGCRTSSVAYAERPGGIGFQPVVFRPCALFPKELLPLFAAVHQEFHRLEACATAFPYRPLFNFRDLSRLTSFLPSFLSIPNRPRPNP